MAEELPRAGLGWNELAALFSSTYGCSVLSKSPMFAYSSLSLPSSFFLKRSVASVWKECTHARSETRYWGRERKTSAEDERAI